MSMVPSGIARGDHQMDIDQRAAVVDSLGDGLQHDRSDDDRLDEVAVADVVMEGPHAGSKQPVDLLAELCEVGRVQRRLDLDLAHLVPRHVD